MKKVHRNMCLILDSYRGMTVFQFPYTPSCEPRSRKQLAGPRTHLA